MKKHAVRKISDMLQRINEYMHDAGYETDVALANDHFRIDGKEVIIKMPFILTVRIPKEELGETDADVNRAVSQAVSRAVSLDTGA